jgi:ribulose kinase
VKTEINPKMKRIMELVQANSQTAQIHSQIIDIGEFIFVQLVHNTDDDSLFLILMWNFKNHEIIDIPLKTLEFSQLKMLTTRFGVTNQMSIANASTMFLSYEFQSLIRTLVTEIRKAPVEKTL